MDDSTAAVASAGSAAPLLFDLDGTIVDSFASIVRCWTETLTGAKLPVPSVEVMRSHVGPPADEVVAAYAPDADAAARDALLADYRTRCARAEDVGAFPGMIELLKRLSGAGRRLGIATSKSREVTEPLLERLDLRRCFEVVQATPVHELGTDKATIVARAVADFAPATPVALVGDRRHDVEGAHRHGLLAVGVLWGYGDRSELVGAGADLLCTSPDALARELATI